MGYDVMAAWDRFPVFRSRDQVLQNDLLWLKESDFQTPCKANFAATNIDYQLHSPTSPPPSFQQAKSSWSPPHSPQTMSPNSSPVNSPPASPLCESAPRRISLSAKGKRSLADKLYAAACAGDLQHVELLLSMGAPIDAGTVVENLYETFKPAKSGRLSPLAGAAGHGQIDMVELLLLHGASINPHPNDSSSSPLHQACRADDMEMARFLLEAGADIDRNNCYRTTSLMYAAKYGSPDLVEMLLSFRPNLHQLSFVHTAAIHWAIWPAKTEVLELLLQAGANPNHPLADGSTPLHCAASVRDVGVVRCLLKYHANPKKRNQERKTALELAEEDECEGIADLLREAQAAWWR